MADSDFEAQTLGLKPLHFKIFSNNRIYKL